MFPAYALAGGAGPQAIVFPWDAIVAPRIVMVSNGPLGVAPNISNLAAHTYTALGFTLEYAGVAVGGVDGLSYTAYF